MNQKHILKLFSKNIIKNIIITHSFTPERFSNKYEKGVPSVDKRLKVIKRLSNMGWKLVFALILLLFMMVGKKTIKSYLLKFFKI